jgi:hypothetical protein
MGLVQHQLENYPEAIKLFLNAYRIVEKELGPRYAFLYFYSYIILLFFNF